MLVGVETNVTPDDGVSAIIVGAEGIIVGAIIADCYHHVLLTWNLSSLLREVVETELHGE